MQNSIMKILSGLLPSCWYRLFTQSFTTHLMSPWLINSLSLLTSMFSNTEALDRLICSNCTTSAQIRQRVRHMACAGTDRVSAFCETWASVCNYWKISTFNKLFMSSLNGVVLILRFYLISTHAVHFICICLSEVAGKACV